MTRSLAYIGVLALVVGVFLTTCVGSAWSMELLTEADLGQLRGGHSGWECPATNNDTGCKTDECCDCALWEECLSMKLDKNVGYKTCVQGTGSCANNKEARCAEWRFYAEVDCFGIQSGYSGDYFRFTSACATNGIGHTSFWCP